MKNELKKQRELLEKRKLRIEELYSQALSRYAAKKDEKKNTSILSVDCIGGLIGILYETHLEIFSVLSDFFQFEKKITLSFSLKNCGNLKLFDLNSFAIGPYFDDDKIQPLILYINGIFEFIEMPLTCMLKCFYRCPLIWDDRQLFIATTAIYSHSFCDSNLSLIFDSQEMIKSVLKKGHLFFITTDSRLIILYINFSF